MKVEAFLLLTPITRHAKLTSRGDFVPIKMTKEEAEKWILENNFGGKFKIVSWADLASKKSRFLDLERNVEFDCEFAIFKRNLKRNPDTTFAISKEEQQAKSEATMNKKYGGHYSKTKDFKERVKKTSLEKYGVENVMKSKDFFEKQRSSLIESHGVDSPLKSREIKERQIQTIRERFGVDSVLSLPSVRNSAVKNSQSAEARSKRLQTMNDRHGCDYPLQNEEIKQRMENTNLEKYGVKSKFLIPEFQAKIFSEKIKSGKIKIYNNKTIAQHAAEKNVSYSWILQQIKEVGLEQAINQDPSKTNLENIISNFLTEIIGKPCFYNKKFKDTKYKPDFLIEENKLIIECDGIFWHSDRAIKDYKYHLKKLLQYKKNGYNCLFFRSDEIIHKTKIVKSIIRNKLGLNERVYARKCVVELGDDSFFDENHLMGKGAGRVYCLKYDNKVVAAIQVKWIKERKLEVSRFCTKNNVSVIGGFDKLIKHVIRRESPESIVTFIDERYGSGEYLEKLGWQKRMSYVSFKWADEKNTFHRLRFPNNSGYEHGFYKIWDCGQAKWEFLI